MIGFKDVNEDLINLLILGCEERSKHDPYFKESLTRLNEIKSRMDDYLGLRDLKVLNGIWRQVQGTVEDVLRDADTQERINQKAKEYRKGMDYSGFIKLTSSSSSLPPMTEGYSQPLKAGQKTYGDTLPTKKERELLDLLLNNPDKFLE